MMANGTLVRVLIHTDVTKYLSFKAVDGGFVYNKGKVKFCSLAALLDYSYTLMYNFGLNPYKCLSIAIGSQGSSN